MFTEAEKSFDADYKELRRLFMSEPNSVHKAFSKKGFIDWIRMRGEMTVGQAAIEAKHRMIDPKILRQLSRQSAYEQEELKIASEVKDE